jgi:rare lipoprotein A
MRCVAGVSPPRVRLATLAAAAVVAVFWGVAGLYLAHHLSSLKAPGLPEPTLATDPSQVPNRAAKAPREAFRKQAELAPQPIAIKPEVAKPAPDGAGDEPLRTEIGAASWYALDAQTASGERMDATALTAAHPALPLGTMVRVTNLDNGRVVMVRINDRGPFAKNRIIDLSKAAAEQLGMIETGVAQVSVTPTAGVVASND